PRNVSSINRSLLTGCRHNAAPTQPTASTSSVPTAACASQFHTGVCHVISAALLLSRLSFASGLADQPFQFTKLHGAGVFRLKQAKHHLIERPIEHLLQEAARDLVPAMAG